MCLAIPAKIIEIDNEEATVDYGGVIKKTNISLVENIKIDDYVIIHAGFAIQKIQKEEAVKNLQALKELDEVISKSN